MNADFSGLKIGIAEAHARRRGRLCILRAVLHKNRVGTGSEKNEKNLVKKFDFLKKEKKKKNIEIKKETIKVQNFWKKNGLIRASRAFGIPRGSRI